MTADLVNAVDRWEEAKAALAAAKKAEGELRAIVVALAFPNNPADAEGTKRVPLGNDREVKAVFKLNYSLDADLTDEALSAMEDDSEEGKFLAERLVKWKPELSVSEFRKLPPKFKVKITSALTVKPATPSLEIVDKSAD